MSYFFSIFFGTFILEDVALASSLALVADGKIAFATAFTACFLGISLGDLGLYGIGQLASRLGLLEKIKFRKSDLLSYSIVISRIIPGARLPTYLSAGFLRFSFWKFLWLTIVSVFVWVFVAFLFGRSLQSVFMSHWILGILIFLAGLHLIKNLIPKLSDRWGRRAFLHSWRKWMSFEFWPAVLFYGPIVVFYALQSLKYRSVFTPFYAKPDVANGGLIGESKWDYLQYLNPKDPSTLRSVRLEKNIDFLAAKSILEKENLFYPLIIKPDVGQRGFAVRILRNDFDLTEYLLLSDFDLIVQSLSVLPMEAGIFYIREPQDKNGYLFSLTDKTFPFVVGDGRTSVGDLILRDQRARIIAPVYFERLKLKLDTILETTETLVLSECGNHCQGAIFTNGNSMITEALTLEIDRIAKQIPDFYFGRFDVRYRDKKSLMDGDAFEIVEVNGAGAEATHIWDADTKIFDAYKTLFTQWSILFRIGGELRKTSKQKIKVWAFLKESRKVFFRRSNLSVSS